MNKKALIILTIILGISRLSYGQKLTVAEVDKKTYDYYLDENWKELKKLGNEALKQGIDFFYLRTRLGLAYYNTKQYRKAAIHFRKALSWYPKDDFSLEYLYYCYLYGGQTADAYKLIGDMSPKLRNKLVNPTKKLRSMGLYYANLETVNPDALRFDDLDGTDDVKGEQTINYALTTPSLSFTWRSYRGYRTLDYSYYSFSNLIRTQENNEPIEENAVYIKQHVFNYTNVVAANPKLDVITNFAFIPGSYTQTTETTISRGRWSTQAAVKRTYLTLNALASYGLKYKNPYFDLTASVSAQYLGDEASVQSQVEPVFYPFSNLNFYLAPGIITKQGTDGFQYLTTAKAGIGLFNHLWIEGGYWQGSISKFNSDFGTFVFNEDENILDRTFGNVYLVGNNITFFFSYSYYTKQRFITSENSSGDEIKTPYNLNSNTFVAGIILNFK